MNFKLQEVWEINLGHEFLKPACYSDNSYFKSIAGILYNKDVSEIFFVYNPAGKS